MRHQNLEIMSDEWKKAILKIWEMHQHIKPEFSCTLCIAKINPQLVKNVQLDFTLKIRKNGK